MLRRTSVTVLIRPDQSWPLWSSLLLHGALFAACCTLPHAPKVHDCIMVDLRMPSLGSLAPMGGRPAPGPKNGPAKQAARSAPRQPAPSPAPPPPRHQAMSLPGQRQAVQQPVSPTPVATAAAAEGTTRGQQTSGAASHGGGEGGTAQGGAPSGGGGSASGSGGSGGGTGPFEGEFGAQGGPTYLNRVLPTYPAFARRIGKEGTVLLRLTLDDRGTLSRVEVMNKAGYGFDEAALAAVKASRFRPALRNGKPVHCRALLPVRFELRE